MYVQLRTLDEAIRWKEVLNLSVFEGRRIFVEFGSIQVREASAKASEREADAHLFRRHEVKPSRSSEQYL